MIDRPAVVAAAAELSGAFEARSSLCSPFVRALPITRAAISMLGDPFGIETVCASDSEAERLDELQIDLGEGPCWDAMSSRSPIVEPDIQNSLTVRWPILTEAIRDAGLRAVFAFPLSVGSLDIGAIDLYSDAPGRLVEQDMASASLLAGIAALQVLRGAIAKHPEIEVTQAESDFRDADDGAYSRREVHQATGMVIAQMGTSADDALLVIRAHAFATGRSVRAVAADVTARRIDFSRR